jgi:hypothetical protein
MHSFAFSRWIRLHSILGNSVLRLKEDPRKSEIILAALRLSFYSKAPEISSLAPDEQGASYLINGALEKWDTPAITRHNAKPVGSHS